MLPYVYGFGCQFIPNVTEMMPGEVELQISVDILHHIHTYEKEITFFFFFQAEDGIRDKLVTGVQTCALISNCVGSSPCAISRSTSTSSSNCVNSADRTRRPFFFFQ